MDPEFNRQITELSAIPRQVSNMGDGSIMIDISHRLHQNEVDEKENLLPKGAYYRQTFKPVFIGKTIFRNPPR